MEIAKLKRHHLRRLAKLGCDVRALTRLHGALWNETLKLSR